MIARLWHGWTTRANAPVYETLLREEVLPGIHRVAGFHGAYLLRRQAGEEVEFVTLTLFDSLEAVRAFAGEDYELADVPPGGRRVLSPVGHPAVHYNLRIEP